MHLTVPAHALLAERLAKEITEWIGQTNEESDR
jgi:hypothetical protein